PMSYHPGKNSLYIPYVDNCLDMTSKGPAGTVMPPAPYEVSSSVCQGPASDPPNGTAAAAASPTGGARGGAAAGGPAGARGGAAGGGGALAERRVAIRRDGSDPQKFAGV